jgi:hypothetical protein
MLPGALATAAFYDDVLDDQKVKDASIRFVARTLPVWGAEILVTHANQADLQGFRTPRAPVAVARRWRSD